MGEIVKKNGTMRMIVTIGGILVPLFVIAGGIAVNNYQTRQATATNEKQDAQIQILREAMIEQRVDIKWIRQKMENPWGSDGDREAASHGKWETEGV